MDELIQECAKFNVRLSQKLSKQKLSFLIWVSPTSYRDPEETSLWHPSFLKSNSLKKALVYSSIFFLSSIIGAIRFFIYHGFFYTVLKNNSRTLLVIPQEITQDSSSFKTEYMIENKNYPIDKIIFSKSKNIGLKFTTLSFLTKIKISIVLIHLLFNDLKVEFYKKKINSYYLCCFVLFLRWILSQGWYFHWDFYHLLTKETLNKKYKILLSLHEMHFYARIMWKICQEQNLMGMTAQHAAIIPEKLWYFNDPIETNAGCHLPHIFYLFSEDTKALLRPFYPKTEFKLCCSPRYQKWANYSLNKISKRTEKKFHILFASTLLFYDVALLLKALKKLLTHGNSISKHSKLILRLHPAACIKFIDQVWLQWASQLLHRLEISSLKLEEDLSQSHIVIGGSSTVLQEALILDIPILALYDPDYLTYSVVPSSYRLSIKDLTWERIQAQMNIKPQESIKEQFKANLGLSNPNLTTELIYQI